jgi:hypothetical protein
MALPVAEGEIDQLSPVGKDTSSWGIDRCTRAALTYYVRQHANWGSPLRLVENKAAQASGGTGCPIPLHLACEGAWNLISRHQPNFQGSQAAGEL